MITNNAINRPNITFLYVNEGSQQNVTGNQVPYVIKYPTKIYDSANVFDGVSTFTAPIAGIYHLEFQGRISVVTNIAFYDLATWFQINTGLSIIYGNEVNYYNVAGLANGGMVYYYHQSSYIKLSANDTVTTNILVQLGTQTCSIDGFSLPTIAVSFGGCLITEL